MALHSICQKAQTPKPCQIGEYDRVSFSVMVASLTASVADPSLSDLVLKISS